MASTETVIQDSVVELACFECGGQTYGVDVLQVREIVRAPEITPLPKAPTLIEGIVDLRGVLVPVVDLARALGHPPCEGSDSCRIAVLELDDMIFGLRVERAVDVLSVEPGALGEPPALVSHAGYDVVRAVVRRPGTTPVLALSVEYLLESVYRSALDGRSEAGAGS